MSAVLTLPLSPFPRWPLLLDAPFVCLPLALRAPPHAPVVVFFAPATPWWTNKQQLDTVLPADLRILCHSTTPRVKTDPNISVISFMGKHIATVAPPSIELEDPAPYCPTLRVKP